MPLVSALACTYDGHFPALTDLEWLTVSLRRLSITIEGPDAKGDLDLTIDNGDDNMFCFVPVQYLANHLRLQGWTVTPPQTEEETQP